MRDYPIIYRVPPARLDWDKGDIHNTYCADTIAMKSSVGRSFEHAGAIWCCVGITGKGLTSLGESVHEGYRLTPEALFEGEKTTYAEKSRRWDEGDKYPGDYARNDPNGFYHGMVVTHKVQKFVLTGPGMAFAPLKEVSPAIPAPAQLSLFEAFA